MPMKSKLFVKKRKKRAMYFKQIQGGISVKKKLGGG